ncbi:UDP-glucose dehydrogenase family protein [Bdellovibrio svalbardensis]|uniref:UDP-glucose 6-dehydrogenase n=1 Tax=Bdellovibrio svalbardensis TaxID=2972972 RepID=A0ABT6DIE0_9BACT|nr:UDP-glucose/GDP-mannose dehydrogenase family protein [Bdellovibrio svalbardensis]MDG0816272.1 UDP-glucose/GDP-mannose dehydrogenase family protein [Bdellovibrio svalbardensis]
MRISVIGTGYVGLVTGTCFAEKGNQVLCADIDATRIEKLNQGIAPFYEPGLEELIKKNASKKRLHFTANIQEAMESAEMLMIAVGTPSDLDGSTDLSYVMSVAESIGQHMNADKYVVVKSTVPVGTCEAVRNVIERVLRARGVNYKVQIVSNPEFLREGAALEDCLYPPRVIVGVENDETQQVMLNLYRPFVEDTSKILFVDIFSSEMTKYAANAMLATRISFMNELSRICEVTGANIDLVKKGMGMDPRIGPHFLNAGVGYGGSCFPKDVKALIKTARNIGSELSILQAVEEVNQQQHDHFFKKVQDYFKGQLEGKTIAMWGLAFKPGTDDLREAPALRLIEKFLYYGARVKAADPIALEGARKLLSFESRVELFDSFYEALNGADALVIVTEWPEFKGADLNQVKASLKNSVIFDGRNIFLPSEMEELGFDYISIGKEMGLGLQKQTAILQPQQITNQWIN